MAGDASFPPSTTSTCMALFFSLLLVLHFTMAVPEHSFSPSTSTNGGAKKRNTAMVAASPREGSTQNPKAYMTRRETPKGGVHVPHHQLQGPERGLSPAPRPPLQWQKRIFNASEHEVPSGPNPISN